MAAIKANKNQIIRYMKRREAAGEEIYAFELINYMMQEFSIELRNSCSRILGCMVAQGKIERAPNRTYKIKKGI